MITDLKPYPAMKDSGLPWLGEVPERWSLVPNKVMLRRRKTLVGERHTDYQLLSLTKTGVIVRDVSTSRGKFSADMGTFQEVRCGDLVFCLFDVPETPRTIGLSHHKGMITGAYDVFECDDHVLTRFLEAFYIAMDDRKLLSPLYLGLRNTIPTSRFLGVKTPVPPLSEQAAIVRYLDHADELINRYISAKQRLIALLEEQRQAVIHQAVTRGLDPNAPSKKSGIEWLDDVPQHWQLPEIKQVSNILRGKFTHRPRNDPSLYGGIYPFIQTGDVAAANGIIRTHRQTLNQQGLAVSTMFPAGTLVMTIAANIGDVAVLNFEACFPDSIVGFVPTNKVERDFLYYLFRAMKSEFLREAPVNTQGNLNVERIGSKKIPLPSVDEQVTIVRHLAEVTAHIDAGIELAHRQVRLIGEYRTRLIADIVTGQIDVRNATVELPGQHL